MSKYSETLHETIFCQLKDNRVKKILKNNQNTIFGQMALFQAGAKKLNCFRNLMTLSKFQNFYV